MSLGDNDNDIKYVNGKNMLDENSDNEFDGKTYYIGEARLRELRAKGFSNQASFHAVIGTEGAVELNTLLLWLDINKSKCTEPLPPNVRVLVRRQRELTEEEKQAKIAELKESIAAARAKEKQEAEEERRRREQDRIQSGKLQMEQRRERQAREAQREAAERRAEEEANARYREQIEIEMLAERKMKQGLDEGAAYKAARGELAENRRKKAEEAERRRIEYESKKAERSIAQSSTTAAPQQACEWNLAGLVDTKPALTIAQGEEGLLPLMEPTLSNFSSIVDKMKEAGATSETFNLLKKILENLITDPKNKKVRKLRLEHTGISRSIVGVKHAVFFLRMVGFVFGEQDTSDGIRKEEIMIIYCIILWRITCALTAIGNA